MSRSHRARALAVFAFALGATACQDYNFNPVGHCLIQPGTQRFTLSNISTADVLFVVDDSNSMAGEQAALAANFDSFIQNLTSTNAARQTAGLEPIDFHIAVTTSSIYWNPFETGQTCTSRCGTLTGQAYGAAGVCCKSSGTPVMEPRKCTSDASCRANNGRPDLPGTSCRLDCSMFEGEFYCCASDGSHTFPGSSRAAEPVTCSVLGGDCGGMQTHYDFQGCTSHIAKDHYPFPNGDFVSYGDWTGLTGTPNPRVLHFDKSLYTGSARNAQGFDADTLVTMFRQNIQVGTCGSGQEQLLQAGRSAILKATSGGQRDSYNYDPAHPVMTPSTAWSWPTDTALPTTAEAVWPNKARPSKLVMVFVGDEDDCSAPADASGADVMITGEGPYITPTDACSRDATDPLPLGHKQYAVDQFVYDFTHLGRPIAAGFILPAAQTSCTLASCTTDGLCCPAGGACTFTEGAQARGTRLLATAKGLAAAGVDVVAGSICDPSFGTLLNEIAEIVKPPETLDLPSVPAEGRIALLRIIGANGEARLCGAALPPAGIVDLAAARATHSDWWFVPSKQPGPPAFDPSICNSSQAVPCPTKYVYINPDGSCKANAGETYSADFIGVSPAPTGLDPGGCVTSAADVDGATDCQEKLGGPMGAYECFAPPGLSRGTCTCKSGQ